VVNIFKFGERKIVKQGGSYVISLPIQWMRSMNPEIKNVTVEMDDKNRLRIIACDTFQDSTGYSIPTGDRCR
jgi:antitoxin component of MazEF toxin-antitoxin module